MTCGVSAGRRAALTGAVNLALGLAWWQHACPMPPRIERIIAASNLAECYLASGSCNKAEGLAHRAWAMWQKVNRRDPSLLGAFINLARVFCDQGQHLLQAARIEARLVAHTHRIYGNEHQHARRAR
jgi:hypothetical protein